MGLFKSRYAKELDAIISRIEMNMANNYKDNAQADLKELEEAFESYSKEGLLKEKDASFYEGRLTAYREKLKGYSHKDQKPYWTK
ncbi:MAG: hypothetical protein K6E62_02840 [Lachnospiraceae bacterium]|nr:hypothetical protein [Lachnospiraceae bacterium]